VLFNLPTVPAFAPVALDAVEAVVSSKVPTRAQPWSDPEKTTG